MIKVEELEQEIKDVEEKLNNLKTKVEELKKNENTFEPTPKTWTPNEAEVFWVANVELKPVVYNNVERFKSRNNRIFKYNRIFQTEGECQLYCDIQRAFRDASREFVCEEDNFYLFYNHESEHVSSSAISKCKCGELYFDSRKTIQNLIDKFGEENVKRYYLGVY